RVAQAGVPQEVYDRPATPFVASFVGGANLLRGQMSGGRASLGALGAVAVPIPDGGAQAPDGTAVHAFVRPHDVTLTKAGGAGAETAPEISVARVERMAWLVATSSCR